MNKLKEIYWRLKYRFQINRWSRAKREDFHMKLYKGYYFCMNFHKGLIPYEGSEIECIFCGEEADWVEYKNRMVIRITLQKATNILKEHFAVKYKKKIILDWMPHELNEHLEVQEEWT